RLRERAKVRGRRVGQRPELRPEPKARVGIAHDEAELRKSEEDVAERALRNVQGTRKLADPHGTAAIGESAQDPRGLVDGRDGTQHSRTLRHTRTTDSTTRLIQGRWPLPIPSSRARIVATSAASAARPLRVTVTQVRGRLSSNAFAI